ncbi:FecCD family ABC transporter permease [Ruania zhangjianzhongii]|uniref:FecCD family ABC transporter permease n=1 Tax=Ruania zhangjianzhongii TaxID=2603206 RepID=UPI0011C8F42D|nr:iron chelate uptake ABC transporter family permease subunit [Ruania zhangjianzhongii]
MTGGLVLRWRRASVRLHPRTLVVCAVLGGLTLVLALWSVTLGTMPLSIGEVVTALTGGGDEQLNKVVLEWRLPRVVGALLFGAALGISGAVFQSLTRNPLGSPDVIGFTTGAFTGVVLTLLAGLTSYAALTAGALAGGLVTAFAVYLFAFRRGVQGFRFIIVGIAVSAFLGGVNTWFSVKVDLDVALRAAVWGAGSLSVVDWPAIRVGAVVLAVVLIAAPAAQRRMRRLELGDDTAAMLGVPVETSKALLILLGVIAIALVTAVAGPIAFVALAAPQIARRLTRQGTSVDLAGSAMVGSLLLLGADIIAQHAIPGVRLPTGAVTVAIGGAYLVWLLARESRRSLDTTGAG